MKERNIGIVGDGATDRLIFGKIVECLLLKDDSDHASTARRKSGPPSEGFILGPSRPPSVLVTSQAQCKLDPSDYARVRDLQGEEIKSSPS
jgi:hypothetical protein